MRALKVSPIANDGVGGQTEKGVDAQKRLVKEFYDSVEDFDPK